MLAHITPFVKNAAVMVMLYVAYATEIQNPMADDVLIVLTELMSAMLVMAKAKF